MHFSLAGSGTSASGATVRAVEWSSFDGADLHARYFAECHGGDFFDGVAVHNRLLFLLTDIAGPRSEANAVAVEVQNTFRAKAQELFAGETVNESDALAALAHAVNLSLTEAALGVRLAPTFLGCFNETVGVLTYCNAGNLLALFRDADRVRVLPSTGMALGLFTHITFEAVFLAFQQGDTLLVITKGVTESRRGAAELGEDGVKLLLKNSTATSADGLCQAVLQQAHDYANHPWSRLLGFLHPGGEQPQDDLTALALVRRAPVTGQPHRP
jgi:serine phosphatase RsbU (regulator of sigma subunit)